MSAFSNIVGFVKNHGKAIGVVAASATAFAATAVCTSKAITKVDMIKKEQNERLQEVKEVLDDPNIPESKYSHEDAANDTRIIKGQAIVKSVKSFVPVISIIGGSIVASKIFDTPIVFIASMLGGTAGATHLFISDPNISKSEKVKAISESLVISTILLLTFPILNLIRFSVKGEATNG